MKPISFQYDIIKIALFDLLSGVFMILLITLLDGPQIFTDRLFIVVIFTFIPAFLINRFYAVNKSYTLDQAGLKVHKRLGKSRYIAFEDIKRVTEEEYTSFKFIKPREKLILFEKNGRKPEKIVLSDLKEGNVLREKLAEQVAVFTPI